MALPKWLLAAILAFSFIGFLDAVYLTVQNYSQGILPCVIFEGCDQVLTSQYAKVWNIPISLVGAIYYLIIFVLAILFIDSKNPRALLVLGYLPIAGFITSLALVFLQVFVIKALCVYCVVSAISSTILFILGLKVLKFRERNENLHQS